MLWMIKTGISLITFLFLRAQQPPVGQCFLIIEASRLHSDTPQSVGLLWTGDRPDAETTHNTHKRYISMPPAVIKPAFPRRKGPQTQTLDRAATMSGLTGSYEWIFSLITCHFFQRCVTTNPLSSNSLSYFATYQIFANHILYTTYCSKSWYKVSSWIKSGSCVFVIVIIIRR
jgi:hypothetical protein